MGTFIPIAMKCNQEQFYAVKPKLAKAGKIGHLIYAFDKYDYLTNNYGDEVNYFDFIDENIDSWDCRLDKIYHEWNEKIFLEACGIEVETLEQQLQKAEAEVKRLQSLIEYNKLKNGDICVMDNGNFKFITIFNNHESLIDMLKIKKIQDQELINKLNDLIK